MRATGVGRCLGIGRFGAIVGPLLGGVLISLKWPNANVFMVLAIPLVCAALSIFAMGLIYAGQTRRHADTPQTRIESGEIS